MGGGWLGNNGTWVPRRAAVGVEGAVGEYGVLMLARGASEGTVFGVRQG